MAQDIDGVVRCGRGFRALVRGSGGRQDRLRVTGDRDGPQRGHASAISGRVTRRRSEAAWLGEPIYQQVAGILRDQITSGRIEPRRPIPSVRTLCETYSIARATAAMAIHVRPGKA